VRDTPYTQDSKTNQQDLDQEPCHKGKRLPSKEPLGCKEADLLQEETELLQEGAADLLQEEAELLQKGAELLQGYNASHLGER
jgi:hypothetical protein